jgi:hypothetical protein
VNLTAQDSGSGVRRLLYSLDGTHYQPYTSPFQANVVSTPTLYAFADDNVANRRAIEYSLAYAAIPQDVYLPVILR